MSQSDFHSGPTGPAEDPQSSGEPSTGKPNGSAEERNVPASGQDSTGSRPPQRFARQGGGGGGRRRRGRGRRGRGPNGQDQHAPRQHRGSGGAGGGGGQRRAFTGPMDHSYRNQNGSENMGNQARPSNQQQRGGGGGRQRFRRGGRGGFQQNFPQPMSRGFSQSASDLEPLAISADAPTRIFAFVEDLFFMTKIQEIGRKLNVKVEFVKTEKDLHEKVGEEEKPSLIIVDLNNLNSKPLTVIPKLKSKFKKGTTILGFVSHVQGELKQKAQEAGCDVVMPRSAFSQTLPQLLRRHGAPEDLEQ